MACAFPGKKLRLVALLVVDLIYYRPVGQVINNGQ